ncbi:MAG: hypothetical protein JWM00_325 [Candidatus Saccharibacteria bacterium]|nr:hypothetical protein [Candidatus Saccharibacteria bacterium]
MLMGVPSGRTPEPHSKKQVAPRHRRGGYVLTADDAGLVVLSRQCRTTPDTSRGSAASRR